MQNAVFREGVSAAHEHRVMVPAHDADAVPDRRHDDEVSRAAGEFGVGTEGDGAGQDFRYARRLRQRASGQEVRQG